MTPADSSARRGLWFAVLALYAAPILSCSSAPTPPAVTRPAAGELGDHDMELLVNEHAAAAEAAPTDASKRAKLGLVYEANQIWTLASRAFSNAAELDPEQPSYTLHAAIAMLRTGRSSEADELIRSTATRFPDFAPARYRLGLALLDEGEAARALVEFEACSRLAPWFGETRVAEAEALLQVGRRSEALARVEDCLLIQPGLRRARFVRGLALQSLGRSVEAEEDFVASEGAVRSYLPDEFGNRLTDFIVDTRILLRAVEDLRSKGWEEQVRRMLEIALQRKPDDALVLNALALAERRRKNSERASQLLERAVTIEPATIEFRINAALAFLDRGLGSEAMIESRRAIELDPENVRAQVVLGLSHKTLGQLNEAQSALEQALTLDGNSYMALLSLLELRVEQERFDLALPLAERIVASEPSKYWPRHFLALSQLRMGHLKEARESLNELRSDFPGSSGLLRLEVEFR